MKAASDNKGSYLYDLPWYLLIGPPGSGKTTALVNSGLKFPLSSRGATPAAIAGVGGTRYCDWWFTEDAVLIDTAGRYTTQDSDAKADKQSWFAFLDLLKKNRPRQPINGVMVAISLEDMMTLSPAEISAHANAIRARLLELHERLKVDFPVYALFTKADLVAGFVEYFGYLGDQGRKQVWGATFQTADKKRNMVGEVPVEFDQLLERLTEETARPPAGRAGAEHARDPVRIPGADGAAEAVDLRLPQPDLRADPLSRQRDLARLLLHVRHAAGQPDRPADRIARALVRHRGGRGLELFGPGQELLPHRPDPEGDHRRGRLGLDRPRGGAARDDHQGGGVFGDRACSRSASRSPGGSATSTTAR